MDESKNLAKTYAPQDIEKRLYEKSVQNGSFVPNMDPALTPFSIVMPPPNITGQLHMGHALDNTLQDVMMRWRRMQGYSALWIPGTDHASIATEAKIVNALKEEGLTKYDLGREGFLERAWAWREKYGGRINEQLKTLGVSCDWDRERFTMDEGCSAAVLEFFTKLYHDGLIYRGERIINWCPHCKTTISDIETIYGEESGYFWHVNYPLADGSGSIEIATTRPETILGDTAVAVHPEDKRYTHLIGKTVLLPILNREIPIVADEYVDMEFGTGAVKITPAHDPNDFEVGVRHNLPMPRVMNDDGTMNELAGKYCGMDRYECRKAIVKDLEDLGLIAKIKDHDHSIGHCQRCNTVIEPILSKQWFVKMKPLAEPAIDVVKSGEVQFVPDRFSKIYYNWMENIQDWCISRQLWWGHRIPAYYCQDCGEIVVSTKAPEKCPKCGGTHWEQDPDSLDTWFSSALWTFSTMGWPGETPELNYYHPTSVLVTGYDIIFFWVARMIFSTLYCKKEIPFKHVYIHGLVRAADGRKMSKSLGNGIDPLEVVEQYGADALRFNLIAGNTPGNDMRFMYEKVEAYKNFANKIWNAARFVLMNYDDVNAPKVSQEAYEANLTAADRWIISKCNKTVQDVTENMEKFEFGMAAQKIYDFIWFNFCDWYIEMVKPRLYGEESGTKWAAQITLVHVLSDAMKLLHPYMPFVTDEIYQHLTGEETIVTAKWPEFDEAKCYEADEAKIEIVMDAIKSIRNRRAEMNVAPSRKAKVIVATANEEIADAVKEGADYFLRLASASEVAVVGPGEANTEGAVSIVIAGAEIYIPMADLVDKEKELERLSKEKANLEKELARLTGKLNNQGFLAKAPQHVVDEEKAKLEKYRQMLSSTEERIKEMEAMK